MNNKELQQELSKHPDEIPVMISIDSKHDCDYETLDFIVKLETWSDNRPKYIEIAGSTWESLQGG